MDWNDVIVMMREAPMPPGEGLPAGVSETEIAECEQRLGMTLPPSLQSWLRACNGPCVGPGGIFGIQPRRKDLDMERILRIHPDWIRRNWIPVAGDGCGNYYLISGADEFGDGEPVFFVDCMRDPTTPAYAVASTPHRFLKFLIQKELGQIKWPFDRDFLEREDPELLQMEKLPLPWETSH